MDAHGRTERLALCVPDADQRVAVAEENGASVSAENRADRFRRAQERRSHGPTGATVPESPRLFAPRCEGQAAFGSEYRKIAVQALLLSEEARPRPRPRRQVRP